MKHLLMLWPLAGMMLAGCPGKDSCNSELGTTFQSIEADSSFLDRQGVFHARLAVQALDVLPDAYFQDFQLLQQERDLWGNPIENSYNQIQAIQADASHISFELKNDSIPSVGQSEGLFIYLMFQDRMDYIDCVHPGSDDSYFLYVTLTLNRLSQDSVRITDLEWKETLNRGGF